MHEDYPTLYTVARDYKRKIAQLERQLDAAREGLAQLDKQFVRIRLGDYGRLYCYRIEEGEILPEIGDWVRVVLPSGKPYYATVKAHGKGDFTGDVHKTAKLVEVV